MLSGTAGRASADAAGAFHIEVRLENGRTRDRQQHVGSLSTACRAAFALAERLSSSTEAADADVRWIDLFDGARLEISIQIFVGEPLTGIRAG